jgi:hypothetical protein
MRNRPINPAVIKLCKDSETSIEGQRARDFFSNPENVAKIQAKLRETEKLNQRLHESRIVTPEVLNMQMKVVAN